MKRLPSYARTYIWLVAIAAAACIGFAVTHADSAEMARFFCYLIMALLASGMKVVLPEVDGMITVSFLFILLGVAELSFAQTLALGCAATLVQCYWKVKRPLSWFQVMFNLSVTVLATSAAYAVYHSPLNGMLHGIRAPMLVLTAAAYFLVNTGCIAAVIGITERKGLSRTWAQTYFWSLPCYLVGASIVGLTSWINERAGWPASLLVLPAVYLIYRSYRLYLGKFEAQKQHVEDMAALHLRTIEALALAIEAKDQTTHDHLQRVRVYALEVAKELAVSDGEMQALKAAALLHDIGKLAVPEHIISKPGRLTPEEFEKMKIHPVVGAEILEQVKFPYPVAPIVRAHHEKWDGSGYPDGLKGEEIPIGARILAAVDCLDALASDRQYRRALPLDEAMERLVADSGKHFDPRVVSILKRRYIELENMARSTSEEIQRAKLSTDIKIERGAAPAAGFAQEDTKANAAASATGSHPDFLASIASARQEVQMLFELSNDLGSSLSLNETLSVLSVRLKRPVPYDSIAIYIHKGDTLVPEFVSGDNFRLFSSLEIPIGEGLSGWVAQNCKPIVNGNPSVEPGYLNDPNKFSTLRSALAVPLEGVSGVVGVLALYRAEADAFNRDDLRILQGISGKLAVVVENALKYRMAEDSASTDYLTGLPNARSLFLHLDREVARCKRNNDSIAVLVCDMDGFKQVNDRFGHLEGNRVLRQFATRLKESCREYDYVARMGGDEFVVIAPGLRAEDADEKVRMLEEMAREVGNSQSGEPLVSLSVGRAFFPDDGPDAEQLLTEADRQMYKTKQQHSVRSGGRSRVLQFQSQTGAAAGVH